MLDQINDKNERLAVYGWWVICAGIFLVCLSVAWFFLTKLRIDVVIK